MVRKLMKVAVAMLLGVSALVLSHDSKTTAADEKATDVKTIMAKSFKDKDAYNKAIPAAAKAGKWDDAQKLAKDWVALSTETGKNKPKKGEAKSWDDQCAKFCDSTKAVLKATEAKDAKAVEAGIKGINCANCHKPHK